MSERQVKGAVVVGYRKFVKKTWGQNGLDELLSAVDMDPVIHEGKWYDDSYSRETLAWIAENKGEEYLERCGKYTIKDLGMLSYIVGFMKISSILKRGPESYSDAFNYGSFKVELENDKGIIKIDDGGVHDPYACQTWIGVFKGMLEVTKTQGTVKELQCWKDGSPYCEFLIEWE